MPTDDELPPLSLKIEDTDIDEFGRKLQEMFSGLGLPG